MEKISYQKIRKGKKVEMDLDLDSGINTLPETVYVLGPAPFKWNNQHRSQKLPHVPRINHQNYSKKIINLRLLSVSISIKQPSLVSTGIILLME